MTELPKGLSDSQRGNVLFRMRTQVDVCKVVRIDTALLGTSCLTVRRGKPVSQKDLKLTSSYASRLYINTHHSIYEEQTSMIDSVAQQI